ncbi:hypothetical protein MKHDV_03726 [Halodesulfovibrio sp. MK-HDV]|nr:hypothetical protein MKHDV_03726 [Halodesulfovibrio sp. MK-HDV]
MVNCTTCRGHRYCTELFDKEFEETDDFDEYNSMYFYNKYTLVMCNGCKTVYLIHQSYSSEDFPEEAITFTQYPKFEKQMQQIFSIRKRKHGVLDFNLPNLDPSFELIQELYFAVNNEKPMLAAMAIRATLELLMIEFVKDNGSFKANFAKMQNDGYLSKVQVDLLNKVLEVGHGVMHRGHQPSMLDIYIALGMLETLVMQLQHTDGRAEAIVKNIPPRKKHQK